MRIGQFGAWLSQQHFVYGLLTIGHTGLGWLCRTAMSAASLHRLARSVPLMPVVRLASTASSPCRQRYGTGVWAICMA